MRQMALKKDLFTAFTDLLALGAFFSYTYRLWQYLIAAHANEGAYAVKRYLVPMLIERLDPGVGMSIITVNQSSVDIQNHTLQTLGHTVNLSCSARMQKALFTTRMV